MTTYGTDLRIGTSPRGNTATLPRTNGSLNRTAKTFPSGKSEIKPFRQGVNKSPSTTPKSPSSDGTAKTVGKVANVAMGIGKKTLGKISPGIGINSKGDIDIGLRVGGAGISLSTKGEISLGIGIGQVTFDPKNKNVGKVEIGLGVASSEATQDGCTITVTDKVLGKIVNQYTRQADDCVEPEPTPEPTPTPSPQPNPNPSDPIKPPKRGSTTSSSPLNNLDPGESYYVYWTGSSNFINYEDNFRVSDPFDPNPRRDFWGNPIDVLRIVNSTWTKNVYESTESYTFLEEKLEYEYKSANDWILFKCLYISVVTGNYTTITFTNPVNGEYFYVKRPFVIGQANTNKLVSTTRVVLEETTPINGAITLATYPPDSHNAYTNYMGGLNWTINDWSIAPQVPEGTQRIEIQYAKINAPPEYKGKPRGLMPEENCDCELLEDIYDMLGGEDFFKDGLEIPNHLFIPGGTGETKAMTYNALLNLMFRTLDHRTVGEVEVSIKDNNIMKEGDQPLTMKLVNATAATGKILELSQKQDSDLTAVLNLLMRLSWISVQILKVVNIGSEATKTIVSFFAIPVKEKVINVDIPVDPSLGGKIGFDPKKPTEDQLIKVLDLDDPEKTVKIFDKFMNNSKIPVKVKQFIGDKSGGNYWWLMDKNKK